MRLVTVYRLEDDSDRVRAMQVASLARPGVGLRPEPHLVGSDDWWRAIERGEPPPVLVEGTISRVWWGSMGDWPMFEVTAADGTSYEWTREGDHTRYAEGLAVRVRYVVQRYKESVQLSNLGTSETELVLSIEIEESDRRSARVGPGPFASLETVALWRPTGPEEMDLVAASGFRRWPPRLPEQPIFYPVLSEAYATEIARDWNVKTSGKGFVTRFYVDREFLSRYDAHEVGGRAHSEYWVPAADLEDLNDHIVGLIEVIAEFP